jgi:hypothetical protein
MFCVRLLYPMRTSAGGDVLGLACAPGGKAVLICLCLWLQLGHGVVDTCGRYSEFDELRRKLMQTFPLSKAALPELPPKSSICKSLLVPQTPYLDPASRR